MSNIFNTVQVQEPKRSKFNLSHTHKMSFKMGNIYPFMWMFGVPGDKVNIRTENLIRFASLATPVMERFQLTIDYYAVPLRYLWEGFEDFYTGKNKDAIPPYVENIWEHPAGSETFFNDISLGSLADHFGIPTTDYANGGDRYIEYTQAKDTDFSLFPFAAYQKVWFDWYRDQNHIYDREIESDWFSEFDSSKYISSEDNGWIIPKGTHAIRYWDSPQIGTIEPNDKRFFQIRKRAWAHDYFTSALPWAQREDAVTIPIGMFNDVPVETIPDSINAYSPTAIRRTLDGTSVINGQLGSTGGNMSSLAASTSVSIDAKLSGFIARTSELGFNSATIDELNKAYKIQRWLQLNARVGQRYVEMVLGEFGQYTEDYRLSRAEYLGGYTNPVVVSEVLQTSGNQENDPNGYLGDMAGRGITASDGKSIYYKVKEHCVIIGILNVQNYASYTQGLPKQFQYKNKFDFATPLLSQIGEQAIAIKELYLPTEQSDWTTYDANKTFGYTPRYSDWKYLQSYVTGDFRDSLDDWQYSRVFQNEPALNHNFIEWSNDNRIFNVTDPKLDNLYGEFNNIIEVDRPLPFYGTPII